MASFVSWAGLGDVAAVAGGHFLQLLQGADLLGQFLALAHQVVAHIGVDVALHGLFLLLNQKSTIQGHAAVVADDAAAAVGVGQAGEESLLLRAILISSVYTSKTPSL